MEDQVERSKDHLERVRLFNPNLGMTGTSKRSVSNKLQLTDRVPHAGSRGTVRPQSDYRGAVDAPDGCLTTEWTNQRQTHVDHLLCVLVDRGEGRPQAVGLRRNHKQEVGGDSAEVLWPFS